MVKKLRNKFVIVTMMLMITVFGIILLINTVYNNYWNSVEIAGMLEGVAKSGIFTSNSEIVSSEKFILDMTGHGPPIVGIIVDIDGNIISKEIIGRKTPVEISETVIKQMCSYGDSKHKIEGYYYSYSTLNDDTFLLVIMDTSIDEYQLIKIFESVILVIVVIIILTLVTFFLSRFVTKPAEQTLLREKQFISDASHELKTPLGAISINAQALELENQDNLYIKNIISEAQRMSRLIEKLLTLSKLDEQENINFSDVNVSDICEEMFLTYESTAFEKNVEFKCDIEPELYIKGNEDELRQLLAILFDNALKNVKELGNVSIKCVKNKNNIEIAVENSGQGISPEDLPHVFERFYTSDTARENNSFGLGLAIAKAIVDRHGGNIDVVSECNKKTIFIVKF